MAVGCLVVIVAATYRTETLCLRAAMIVVLGLDIADRAILGYLRLKGASGESITAALNIIGPVRMVLAVSMFVLAAAIFALDRVPPAGTDKDENDEERKTHD